jgi:hypothetical protein
MSRRQRRPAAGGLRESSGGEGQRRRIDGAGDFGLLCSSRGRGLGVGIDLKSGRADVRLMHLRDFRGGGEGRTNNSRSLDEMLRTAEILFSCQVYAFISSRDMRSSYHCVYSIFIFALRA